MKFTKYFKESVAPKKFTLELDEEFDPPVSLEAEQPVNSYRVHRYGSWWYGVIGPNQLFLRDEDNELLLFRTPAEAQEYIDSTLIESMSDMDRRCEKCNTLLNDGGTCPKCDDGEEDYGDEVKSFEESVEDAPTTEPSDPTEDLTETIEEELSNREKLMRAFPGEFNFDKESFVENMSEEMSVREKLKRAYPELNFDKDVVTEECTNEELSNKEKLKRAYPELNFDNSVEESYDEYSDDYDDEYDIDDVEEDRRHAALYGGDRMYCDCGEKLKMTEWGGYCPVCDAEDLHDMNTSDNLYDDEL